MERGSSANYSDDNFTERIFIFIQQVDIEGGEERNVICGGYLKQSEKKL